MKSNLRIIDLPREERPREKLLKYGADKLSNSELLALILRVGSDNENILHLCDRILSYTSGLEGLLTHTPYELMNLKGIKEAKASQLAALAEIAKRMRCIKSNTSEKISKPADAACLVMAEMNILKQEVLKVIMLNTKNYVILMKDIFKGSLNSSIVHPREIFTEALRANSAAIIVCHNHPSGDPEPSKEDINITLRLKECGSIMGIELLDHIIIGGNSYISLKEKGII
ncbi:RadC family protein [Clostridium polynesiense]|uniref:RadC family protein n=1 Tax=Clostridium polynesiense TaxID=1325933 RepID=UPI00058EA173|nr:DNA repair protein RadC [Clostridium polynesiense]